MQEFSSISVSSYEPGTLADRLNEQAADGWALVTVVPTGATVTAYLSRERASGAQSAPSPVADVTPAPAASTAGTAGIGTNQAAAPSEPDTSVAIEGGSGPGMGASQAATEPVDEPGGWAVSPEPAISGSTSEPTLPSYGTGGTGATGTGSSSSESGIAESATTAVDTATSAGVAAQSTAASTAAAAPAGWYADPSSRYELRYWDGSQWTEHVSRAGQQFTDPPVA
jgi:hypothetical protein